MKMAITKGANFIDIALAGVSILAAGKSIYYDAIGNVPKATNEIAWAIFGIVLILLTKGDD